MSDKDYEWVLGDMPTKDYENGFKTGYQSALIKIETERKKVEKLRDALKYQNTLLEAAGDICKVLIDEVIESADYDNPEISQFTNEIYELAAYDEIIKIKQVIKETESGE